MKYPLWLNYSGWPTNSPLSPRRERVRACPVLDTGVRGNNLKTIFNEGGDIWSKKD